MKMFKKLMAVALVGVMALSMLTGCAVTDAIVEKQAEKALEHAYTTYQGQDVEFTQVDKDAYKKVAETLKKDIQNKKKTYDKATTVKFETKDYSVVVVPAPKSATTYSAWEKVIRSVIEKVEIFYFVESAGTLKGKVNIQVVEGVKYGDENKSQDYVIFVFAATKAAYEN